jgi:hypothetical protein
MLCESYVITRSSDPGACDVHDVACTSHVGARSTRPGGESATRPGGESAGAPGRGPHDAGRAEAASWGPPPRYYLAGSRVKLRAIVQTGGCACPAGNCCSLRQTCILRPGGVMGDPARAPLGGVRGETPSNTLDRWLCLPCRHLLVIVLDLHPGPSRVVIKSVFVPTFFGGV